MDIGDKLKSECACCGKEEIWEVDSIEENVEYSDGKFRAYNLRAIKNCIGEGITTSVKDCPAGLEAFHKIKKQ